MARQVHPISSADLLAAIEHVPAEAHEALAELAKMLGYEFDSSRVLRDRRGRAGQIDIKRPARPAEAWGARGRDELARPQWQPVAVEYAHDLDAPIERADPLRDRTDRLKAALDIGLPLHADAPPARESIAPWARLRRAMEQVCRQPRRGQEADIPALIDRIAAGEALLDIPRRTRRTRVERVVVVVDRSDHLIPIWPDQLELFIRLRREFGRGVCLRWWDNGPPLVRSDAGVLAQVDPALAPGDVVLVLGDLCALAGQGNPGYRAWRALGSALRRRGMFTAALLPLPRVRWPADLTRAWQAIEWERPSGGRSHVSRSKRGEREALLLALCSWVERLEPALLRALRKLVPGADLGLELDLWNDPDARRHTQGLMLSKALRQRGQHELRARMKDAECAGLIRRAITCVKRHHAPLAREIWTEELTKLELLGPGRWLDANELERVERFARRVRNELELGSKRMPQLLAWVARARGPDDHARACIDARSHSQLGPAIERSVELFLEHDGREQVSGVDVTAFQGDGEQRRWQLREIDERLWIGSPDGEHGNGGSWVADLHGQSDWVAIDEVTYRVGPDGIVYSMALGEHALKISTVGQKLQLERASKPSWAQTWGRDAYGLWASLRAGEIEQRMRWIPPGYFQTWPLDRGFWLADTPCTQELWRAVVARNPSQFSGDQLPVHDVSWQDARVFCRALTMQIGGDVRLPMEIQWEYACRAGADDWPAEDELDDVAWHRGNSEVADRVALPHRVGFKQPNAWGLYDTLGNVWEWCDAPTYGFTHFPSVLRVMLLGDGSDEALPSLLSDRLRDTPGVVLTTELRPSLKRLPELVDRFRPTVVHINTAGDADGRARNGADILDVVEVAELGELLAEKGVEVVVLDASHTSAAALILADHVDVVIAYEGQLTRRAAHTFAGEFYARLARSESVVMAYTSARTAVQYQGDDDTSQLWVRDLDTQQHIVRGGSWREAPNAIDAARYERHPADHRANNIGFRFCIKPEPRHVDTSDPSPTRRALLLGAAAPDLRGVAHDLELMREALHHHGFTDIRTVTPATRDAIHHALATLIDAANPGDAVILYYSGHASTLADHHLDAADRPAIGEASMYRFLVPSDIEDSTEADFRGYTNIELSEALARLTAKTANVTAIMDCCHAGRVFRRVDEARERIEWQDLSKRQPARHVLLEGMFARSAARHYRHLREQGRDERLLHAEANPWAVQLLAADPSKPAFEIEVPSRSREQPYYAGAMTLALHDALMKVDSSQTTWQDVGRMIRRTPQRGSSQRVAVEGPYRRFLFSERERQAVGGSMDLMDEGERIRVAGGRLVGLIPGDEVELFSLERGVYASIGIAELRAVHSSWAELGPFARRDHIDSSSYAWPRKHAIPKAALAIRALGDVARALLEPRLTSAGLLQLLEPDTASTLPFAGELRAVEDDRIELCAPNGDGLLGLDRPRIFDPAYSPRTTTALAIHLGESAQRLARAAMLRALPEPSKQERLRSRWELTMHTVVGDRLAQPLEGGETLATGTAITATLRAASGSTLYCNVLQVRADGRIRLLSRAQGGSVEVLASESYRLGQRAGDPSARVRGVELEHPRRSSLDPAEPTQFDILVVVSDEPVDLRSWEQPGVTRFNPRDPLLPESVTRNLSSPRRIAGARYHVQRFSFMLA